MGHSREGSINELECWGHSFCLKNTFFVLRCTGIFKTNRSWECRESAHALLWFEQLLLSRENKAEEWASFSRGKYFRETERLTVSFHRTTNYSPGNEVPLQFRVIFARARHAAARWYCFCSCDLLASSAPRTTESKRNFVCVQKSPGASRKSEKTPTSVTSGGTLR